MLKDELMATIKDMLSDYLMNTTGWIACVIGLKLTLKPKLTLDISYDPNLFATSSQLITFQNAAT